MESRLADHDAPIRKQGHWRDCGSDPDSAKQRGGGKTRPDRRGSPGVDPINEPAGKQPVKNPSPSPGQSTAAAAGLPLSNEIAGPAVHPDWRQRYGHPVPWESTFRPSPTFELLERSARRAPDAPCLDFFGRSFSYREIAELADRAAEGFRRLGIGKGSRVGLFLPNCPQYVISYYGAMKAGATAVNFSPLYSAEELAAQVEDSETGIMVCLDAAQLYPTVSSLLASSRLERLVVASVPDALPAGKALLYRLFKSGERVSVNPDAAHIPFGSLLDNDGLADPPAIDPGDLALLQYTGGTTGTPKGAMLTHANLSINAQQVNAIDPEPQADERILGALPLFHVFANTCVLNRTIFRGGEIVLLPKFDPLSALRAIERKRVTSLPGVPTMFQALLDHPAMNRFDLSSLRLCISGGAAMPAALKAGFEQATGSRLVEGYGLTESSGVVAANPLGGPAKSGSIGQPVPGTRVLVVDKEDPRRTVAPGQPGELIVEGPQMMAGYWRRDEETASVFVNGRLRTGDVGHIDGDGFIFIVDRLKDMISVGGFKVFPSQLEAVLHAHPAVREALVIGVADAYLGERPKAYVTLRENMPASEDELLGHLNAHVGKHERAVAVVIRDMLPETMIGKPDRKALALLERKG